MIAPQRRAYRLVAEAEAFSIPQIMAFAVLNLRAGETSAEQKGKIADSPGGVKNQPRTPSAMAFARASQ
jgi:hypothetical protein